MTELTNAAFFQAKSGKTEDLGARLLTLVEPTRLEPGCIRYDSLQSTDDPNAWLAYEVWRSPADFEAHMNAPYIAAFMPLVLELCERDVEICVYTRRSHNS